MDVYILLYSLQLFKVYSQYDIKSHLATSVEQNPVCAASEAVCGMQELNTGYENGSDRLILRFPQLVTHIITPQSPLAPWSNAKSLPKYAAELVVVVEGVMFYNSSNVMRTITYKLPENLKHGQSFVPMVSRGDSVSAVPVVNWQAFHATVPTGSTWVPGATRPCEAASARPDVSGQGGGNFGFDAATGSPSAVPAGSSVGGEVEMSVQ